MAAPAGFEVLAAINVRVAPGKILISDLAVVTTSGEERTVADPADVALIVEITSPGNAAVDRAISPPLCAHAGSPHYLRIELGPAPPSAVVFRLRRGRYAPLRRARAGAGEWLCLDEPFAVDGPRGPGHRHPPPNLALTIGVDADPGGFLPRRVTWTACSPPGTPSRRNRLPGSHNRYHPHSDPGKPLHDDQESELPGLPRP